MTDDSPDLKTAILERIRADGPRKVGTPIDFIDLASRDAADKTLQRLTNAENLRRIDRGLYDQLGFNKLTQKPNPPDPRSVIDAVGRRDQNRMLVDGMTAAERPGPDRRCASENRGPYRRAQTADQARQHHHYFPPNRCQQALLGRTAGHAHHPGTSLVA